MSPVSSLQDKYLFFVFFLNDPDVQLLHSEKSVHLNGITENENYLQLFGWLDLANSQ